MHVLHFYNLVLGSLFVAKYEKDTGKINELDIFMVDDNLILHKCKIESTISNFLYKEIYNSLQNIIQDKIMNK